MLLLLRLYLVVQFQQLTHHNRLTLLDHSFTQTLLQQPNPQLLCGQHNVRHGTKIIASERPREAILRRQQCINPGVPVLLSFTPQV